MEWHVGTSIMGSMGGQSTGFLPSPAPSPQGAGLGPMADH